MSSSECVVAKFKSQSEDSMLIIEWEKHEGHRLLHYYKPISFPEYQYPHSKTNYGKDVSAVFPAFRRRVLKDEKIFISASARLLAGSMMRKEGDKYVVKDENAPRIERHISLTKVEGGGFDLSLIEETKKNSWDPPESTKVIEAEIFPDLRKATLKMQKMLKADDVQSDIEHQAWLAYIKEKYPPQKQEQK